jgi:hypothetical protein
MSESDAKICFYAWVGFLALALLSGLIFLVKLIIRKTSRGDRKPMTQQELLLGVASLIFFVSFICIVIGENLKNEYKWSGLFTIVGFCLALFLGSQTLINAFSSRSSFTSGNRTTTTYYSCPHCKVELNQSQLPAFGGGFPCPRCGENIK